MIHLRDDYETENMHAIRLSEKQVSTRVNHNRPGHGLSAAVMVAGTVALTMALCPLVWEGGSILLRWIWPRGRPRFEGYLERGGEEVGTVTILLHTKQPD